MRGGRVRPRRRTGAAAAALAMLLTTSCTAPVEPAAAPEPPTASMAPTPEAPQASPGEPSAPSGPTALPGWAEGAAFTEDYDPFPAPGSPDAPPGAGPLRVTYALVEERLACIEYESVITDVHAGSDPAGRRIATELLDAARTEHADWATRFATEADCLTRSGEPLARHGVTSQSLHEETCGLPDGTPLRCFMLIDTGFTGGANIYLRLDVLAFDATTGSRLTLDEIVAPTGLDLTAAAAVVDEVACLLLDWEYCPSVGVPRGRPTMEGLVIDYSRYEISREERQLFVPWTVFAAPRG